MQLSVTHLSSSYSELEFHSKATACQSTGTEHVLSLSLLTYEAMDPVSTTTLTAAIGQIRSISPKAYLGVHNAFLLSR